MSRPILPCTQHDPEMWFPVSAVMTPETERAISLCHLCPIQQECLQDALTRLDFYGILGGTTAAERRDMLRSTNANRPNLADSVASTP
jgi:hypothetical protein